MEQILAQQRVTNSRILRTENRIKDLQSSVAKMFETLDLNIQSHISSFEKTIQKLDKSLSKDNKKILDKLEKQFSNIGSIMSRVNQNIESNTKLVDGLAEYTNEQASSRYDISEEEMESAKKQDKQIQLLTQIAENTEFLKNIKQQNTNSPFGGGFNFPNLPNPFARVPPAAGAQPKPAKPPATPKPIPPVVVPPGAKDDKDKPKSRMGRTWEAIKTAGSRAGSVAGSVGRGAGAVLSTTTRAAGAAAGAGWGAVRGIGGMFGPIGAAMAAFKATENVLDNKELQGEFKKEDKDWSKIAAVGGEELAKGIISGLSLGLISEDAVGTFIRNVREKYLSPEFFDALFGSFDKLLKKVNDFGVSFEKMYDDFAVKFGIKEIGPSTGLSESQQARWKKEETQRQIVDMHRNEKEEETRKSNQAEIVSGNVNRVSSLLKGSRGADLIKAEKILNNMSPEQINMVAKNVEGTPAQVGFDRYMVAHAAKNPAQAVAAQTQQPQQQVVSNVTNVNNNAAASTTNVVGGKAVSNPKTFQAT